MKNQGIKEFFLAFNSVMLIAVSLLFVDSSEKYKKELQECKSNKPSLELVAYQQMDTTNRKTIKLLYDINAQIHHKYDSLLTKQQND